MQGLEQATLCCAIQNPCALHVPTLFHSFHVEVRWVFNSGRFTNEGSHKLGDFGQEHAR